MNGQGNAQRMKVLKEVGIRVDKLRGNTEDLGKTAAEGFGDKHKSQMKNLETIANSALKVSDVLDYIKRQTGRAKPNQEWKYQQFGKNLLGMVEKTLKQERDSICGKLAIDDDFDQLEVYLLIVRECVRQIVIHFEFELGTKETA